MLFLKVSNIKTMFGSMDYKGLDLSKVVPGSPVYAKDFNTVHLATEETELPPSADIEVVAESEYLSSRENQEQEIQSDKDRITQLEQDNLTALAAIAELYELLMAKEA